VEKIFTERGLITNGRSLYSPQNIMLMHHLIAALKAHTLFQRDKEYVVQNGEVIIVDEFTGRLMPGRRWSDGIHQAVEAKEHVKVQQETMTMASITFQNYFRMYDKLSGMTGTADTEAYEFQDIYGLETVVIPTNRPMIRVDQQDKVFKTAKEKYDAIVKDVKDCYSRGEPVLVGTTSIENSELLSHLMEKEGIPHNVLNAKQHEREAQIVAEAGRPGAVTIATNMAGRGTDIVLGGSISKVVDTIRHDESLTEEQKKAKIDEEKAAWQKIHEQVVKSGGLRIIGSERHESRRIDNQLRGRSGRQGDPGSTCFYLSMEDNLLKIFGGDRMKAMATHLKLEEGIPIESKMLSRMIENAQRKVEARNYDIRKQLLEFDDVQNDQRHEIYKVRNEILDSQDLSESVREMRHGFYSDLVRQYVPAETVEDQWDLDGLTSTLRSEWAVNLDTKAWMEEDESRTDEDLEQKVLDEADRVYNEKVELVGADAWNGFCRSVLLQVLDQTWRQHISALDLLRQGIFLRGYAQKQPKQEYKKEAFSMFEELLDLTREGVVRILMQVQIQMPEEAEEAEHEATEEAQRQVDAAQASQAEFTSLTAPENEPEAQEATVDDIAFAGVGRNDPCPCGSGKKFKDCHGKLN
jgi:preprotein translocase subunit SecA